MQSLLCYHTVSHFQGSHNICISLAMIIDDSFQSHVLQVSRALHLLSALLYLLPQSLAWDKSSHIIFSHLQCDWETVLNMLKRLLHVYVFQFELDLISSAVTVLFPCFFLRCTDLFIFSSPSMVWANVEEPSEVSNLSPQVQLFLNPCNIWYLCHGVKINMVVTKINMVFPFCSSLPLTSCLSFSYRLL